MTSASPSQARTRAVRGVVLMLVLAALSYAASYTSPAAADTCGSTEPIPTNEAPNHRPATAADIAKWRAEAPDWFPATYRDYVTGDATGTTTELIEWAAAKWRWPSDLLKSQAWKESGWDMRTNGDGGLSWGIMQLKQTSITGTFPASRDSTAFNLDVSLALLRAYFDGQIPWAPEVEQDYWKTLDRYCGCGPGYNTAIQHYMNEKVIGGTDTWPG